MRFRVLINLDVVYWIVMRKLNILVLVLEVMGVLLIGIDLCVYVMFGGGLWIKGFKFWFSNKWCFIIFFIIGVERKGFVSIEVKKKKG